MEVNPTKVSRARRVLARVEPIWRCRPGVTGLDVGVRLRGNELGDEIALRVYVHAKRPRSAIAEGECFPREIDGVPVDVIEFDPHPPSHPPTRRPSHRTLRPPAHPH